MLRSRGLYERMAAGATVLAALAAGCPRETPWNFSADTAFPLAISIAVTTDDAAVYRGSMIQRPQCALLDLQSADELRRGYCLLQQTTGDRLTGVIVQAVAGAGLITPRLRVEWPYAPASGACAVHTGKLPQGRALP